VTGCWPLARAAGRRLIDEVAELVAAGYAELWVGVVRVRPRPRQRQLGCAGRSGLPSVVSGATRT